MEARATIGLYWGPRPDKLDHCAQLCAQSLQALIGVGFAEHFRIGRRLPSGSLRPIPTDLNGLRTVLERGMNRTDVGKIPMPELGYNIASRSEGSGDTIYSLSIHCGVTAEHVPNVVLFKFAHMGEYAYDADPARAGRAFELLCAIWHPDKAALWKGDVEWDATGDFSTEMNLIARHPVGGSPNNRWRGP